MKKHFLLILSAGFIIAALVAFFLGMAQTVDAKKSAQALLEVARTGASQIDMRKLERISPGTDVFSREYLEAVDVLAEIAGKFTGPQRIHFRALSVLPSASSGQDVQSPTVALVATSDAPTEDDDVYSPVLATQEMYDVFQNRSAGEVFISERGPYEYVCAIVPLGGAEGGVLYCLEVSYAVIPTAARRVHLLFPIFLALALVSAVGAWLLHRSMHMFVARDSLGRIRSLTISCDHCGKRITQVRVELAGRRAPCPHCNRYTSIPALKEACQASAGILNRLLRRSQEKPTAGRG